MMRLSYYSLVVGVALGGLSLGCASDTTGPAPTDPAHLYSQLTLNHHAITMAVPHPYDTLQLTATLSAATGTALGDTGMTTWTSSDSSSVYVSSTGLLTALAPTVGVFVVARHTIGQLTHADTAVVNVNASASNSELAQLTLQLSDTLYYDVVEQAIFTPTALDAQGNTIPNVVFRVSPGTPEILDTASGLGMTLMSSYNFFLFQRRAAGHARLIVEATVYGTSRVETIPFTVGWLHQALVGVQPQHRAGSQTLSGVFILSEDTIAVNGIVVWQTALPGQMPIDVVFDDSMAVQGVDSATFQTGVGAYLGSTGSVIPMQGGGNIPTFAGLDTLSVNQNGFAFTSPATRARSFPVAGTYRYHSVLYGTTGIIHVLPEFQVP